MRSCSRLGICQINPKLNSMEMRTFFARGFAAGLDTVGLDAVLDVDFALVALVTAAFAAAFCEKGLVHQYITGA